MTDTIYDIAAKSAKAMWANDAASRALGMTVDHTGPGTARVSMPVTADMVNGLDVCHGGLIFTLADSAMAFASNSYNTQALATTATINWLAPARLGDVLTATATEMSRSGRSGVYDTQIHNADGDLIAVFRGATRSIGVPLYE